MTIRPIEIKKILGEIPESENVKIYVKELIDIRNELYTLESEVVNQSLGISGYTLQTEITEFEQRLREIDSRIEDARLVAVEGDLQHIVDAENKISSKTGHEMEYWISQGTFDREIQELKVIAKQVDERIETRRSSANSRMGLVISLTALVISTAVMILSGLGLFLN